MKKISVCYLLALFLFLYLTAPGFSQTAQEIVAKMIEAQGGKKLLEIIKDTTVSGSMEMPSMGMTGSFTRYQKEPNKMRMDIEVQGMVITQAFDGQVAWQVNPMTGSTEELPEQMAVYFKRDALGNDSILHPEKYGISFSFKGKEQVEGKDYLVLEQTFSDGYKATFYLDAGTFLPYKTKAMTLNQMGIEVQAETIMSDYKNVGGMMIPHSLKIFQDGEEFVTITVTEAKFNSGLEDALFAMTK